jgi:hypothetical protein
MGRVSVTQPTLAVDRHGAQLAGIENPAERSFDERCAAALGAAFRESHLPIEHFKALVRDQFFVLLTERERGVQALGTLVPEADKQATLLQRLNAIVGDPSQPSTPASPICHRCCRFQQRSRRLQRPLRWWPPNNGLDPAIEGRYPSESREKNFEETSDERASTDPHAQLAVHAGDAPRAFCKGN